MKESKSEVRTVEKEKLMAQVRNEFIFFGKTSF